MLNVWYKKVMGTMTSVERRADGVKKFKIKICQCNALAAFIYPYKNEEGERINHLWAFIADNEHITNMLRAYHKDGEKPLGELQKIRLNMHYKESKSLLNFFVQQGFKVQCYYKRPKK